MNNNFDLSPEQTQRLLNIAGQQLGADPGQLRQQLENGGLAELMGRMSPQQAAQMNQLLQNPEALRQTLASPAVRMMLGRLLGGR